MRNKLVFFASAIGALLAIFSAFVFGQQPQPLPPAYSPAANPYARGIYSEGIVESAQTQGENINIYPEVAGPIARVLVSEGQSVRKGDILVMIDDSVQRPTTEQQKAQLTEAIVKDVMTFTGVGDEAVSVSIEEIGLSDWMEKVYQPDILNGPGKLYKKPGYDPRK